MALVVLDAGHGGSNPGAVYQGRQEKDDALALLHALVCYHKKHAKLS